MAVNLGILELILARALGRQHRTADRWFLSLAGEALGGFALTFLALGLRWIEIGPGSHLDLFWLGEYFAFCAACLLALAMRLPGRDAPASGGGINVPVIGAPGLAHKSLQTS